MFFLGKRTGLNHGTLMKNVDAETFCKEEERLIIFPQRHPRPMASNLCTSHGGQLITPSSLEENDESAS